MTGEKGLPRGRLSEYIISRIIDNPLGARRTWIHEATDILTDKWVGRIVVDRVAAADCRPDEWLLIEAWDES